MLSFKLPKPFVDEYRPLPVKWGYTDINGNSLGEIVFLRTYSRVKSDGSKETWVDCCERVINGMFSIQKDHCAKNDILWNQRKAQRAAKDAFDRLWNLKWTPPGRGLWAMGTPLVNERGNSAPLQNCMFVSTSDVSIEDPGEVFSFLMESLMLGIGAGFDTKMTDLDITINKPNNSIIRGFLISDDREGWVESVRLLLNSFLLPNKPKLKFDYSKIRAAGSPIRTFGGVASGPGPLKDLHETLSDTLSARVGSQLTSLDVMDIANLIGRCVVAGNVRRSAEIALGSMDDEQFLGAKDYSGVGEYRKQWGWLSNNSVVVNVGEDLSPVIEGIKRNGEPGVVWLDVIQNRGRLVDPPDDKDKRALGVNACSEQPLESRELCNLVDVYLNNNEDLSDLKKTLKVAYLYAKTVTLLPTHWTKTNTIMQRNRRIGTGLSGVANFVDKNSYYVLKDWLTTGYDVVRYYDRVYSDWMCVRESNRVTTCKPSGTVSILANESPGVHWTPGGKNFLRGIIFQNEDPILEAIKQAGYTVEPSVYSSNTSSFVQFPIESKANRSDADVSIFEKAHLAMFLQRYWSDNGVSVTLSFDEETESEYVETILRMYEGELKAVSFLPRSNFIYEQMPYKQINSFRALPNSNVNIIDFSNIYYKGQDIEPERYCTNDSCSLI